jgi:hypothetical protein
VWRAQVGPYTAGGRTVTFDSPCDYFQFPGKAKASTLSLSVLVAIEMFNALNALSEVNTPFSLFRCPLRKTTLHAPSAGLYLYFWLYNVVRIMLWEGSTHNNQVIITLDVMTL